MPPYWETTVHAPASLEPGADMIIDDLPTGSFWIFAINIFISFFFQFVGFLLTYLLHTSHAAKFGSRAGLGLTLIQFGFYSRTMNFTDAPDDKGTGTDGEPASPSDTGEAPIPDDSFIPGITSKDWLSFLFMTLGDHISIFFTMTAIHQILRMVSASVVFHRILAGEALGKINSHRVRASDS